jgi:hypothetical protein
MWTEEREGEGYPSDLRNAGSARLAILEASPGGRSRKTDMRAAMTTFSICCAPGAAGALPRDSYPPRSTVHNIFRKLPRDGVSEAIWAELHMTLRERLAGRWVVNSTNR